ncbi:tyrosine-type recombinase/integrase [Capnocytophaga stomatis]|uniref:Tyrosine-type recombinase/integrase n=1 Tax=Capnocytophaga stomatis TaxID=1848904 RepID=A0ABW8Q9H7_9FLAO
MYFYLKEPKSDKPTPIIIQYYSKVDKKIFKYTTGVKISPEEWDFDARSPKVKRGAVGLTNSHIKTKISVYNDFLITTINNMELNGIAVTVQELKNAFDLHFKNKTPETKEFEYFTDFIDDFCEKAPNLINKSTKKHYEPSKIKHYKKTANRLREYEAKHGKLKISSFTTDDYEKFVNYLYSKRYATNTVGDLVKNVKVLLKKAEEMKYSVLPDYKEFSVLKEESVSIALSEDEIQRIFDYDFSNNPRLENCRDLAIIGFWTGLRVSDFLSLPEIKPEDKFITVQPQKTKHSSGIKVVIPLHHHIKEMISKRGMPKSISDVKFNLYIKEVCQIVGLVEPIRGSLMNAFTKRKETAMYPKWQLVSSHTCRRSFATNLYKMNFPTISIMKITGHTSEKTFLSYIKVTPTEHAEKLLAHWEAYYNQK